MFFSKKNLATTATLSRVLIAPLFLLLFYLGLNQSYIAWTAALLFMFGSITDGLDGYWARKYKTVSTMGKFLDPIADKILVLGALLALLASHQIDIYMVFILLSRDLWIGGIRSIAASDQIIISAKPLGKWKTALQMFCIPCLFLKDQITSLPLEFIGYWGLWLSVVLSLFSGLEYTLSFFKGHKKN